MIHMGSDHSCVMAINKKRRADSTEATFGETDENTKDENLVGQVCGGRV